MALKSSDIGGISIYQKLFCLVFDTLQLGTRFVLSQHVNRATQYSPMRMPSGKEVRLHQQQRQSKGKAESSLPMKHLPSGARLGHYIATLRGTSYNMASHLPNISQKLIAIFWRVPNFL